MLTLPIKREWFNMILCGIKTEEYREVNPYYEKRFRNIGLLDSAGMPTPMEATILLRNGYSKSSPTIMVDVTMAYGEGCLEWGAETGERYFILQIQHIHNQKEEKKRWMA